MHALEHSIRKLTERIEAMNLDILRTEVDAVVAALTKAVADRDTAQAAAAAAAVQATTDEATIATLTAKLQAALPPA